MDYAEQKAKRVLEPRSTPVLEPRSPTRGYLLGLLALALLTAWLDSGNLGAQIVEERHQQITECQLAKKRAAEYARALTHLLNQQTVVIGETTRVSCRVREVQS